MALTCATIVVGLLASATIGNAGQQEDIAAIRAVQERQADAWNRHDASAYARLFTDDGDVVNVVGWWWKCREEIEAKLRQAFRFVFAESTLTITETSVRFLSADIAAFQNTSASPEVPFPAGPPAGKMP